MILNRFKTIKFYIYHSWSLYALGVTKGKSTIMKFKISFAIFILASLMMFSSCQSKDSDTANKLVNERKEVSDFLGATDKELTDKKGDGIATSYVHNNQQMIAQRKYEQKVFDMDAVVEYFYSDDGKISEAVAVFDGIDKIEITKNVTAALGEPSQRQEQTNETQFCYIWVHEGISYTLLSPPSTPPALIIQKEVKQ